jgi:hypothetical protein
MVSEKRKQQMAAWREANKEKLKAYFAARRKDVDYKEKFKVYHAAWRAANPGRWKTYREAFEAANPEWKKEWSVKYRAENKERSRVNCINRRATQRKNGGKLSTDISDRLLTIQKGKCSICKSILKTTGHHIDHIIPLARGGKNEDRNVQLTCPKCNLKKNNKDPIIFMREQGYLL